MFDPHSGTFLPQLPSLLKNDTFCLWGLQEYLINQILQMGRLLDLEGCIFWSMAEETFTHA
jgi:hypothetical protein